MKTFLLFIGVLLVFSKGKKLPSYIETCHRNDPNFTRCVKEHALQAIPAVLKGDKSFGNPSLVPLHLDLIEIKPSDQLSIKLLNITLTGLETITLHNITIDLERRQVMTKQSFKTISLLSEYNIDGRILLLNLHGNGPANLTFDDVVVNYGMNFNLITKNNGKQYIDRDLRSNVTYSIGKSHYQFDNLFNGNPEIGEQVNKFLNENGSEIGEELGGTISETIGAIVTNILQFLIATVSYTDVFPE